MVSASASSYTRSRLRTMDPASPLARPSVSILLAIRAAHDLGARYWRTAAAASRGLAGTSSGGRLLPGIRRNSLPSECVAGDSGRRPPTGRGQPGLVSSSVTTAGGGQSRSQISSRYSDHSPAGPAGRPSASSAVDSAGCVLFTFPTGGVSSGPGTGCNVVSPHLRTRACVSPAETGKGPLDCCRVTRSGDHVPCSDGADEEQGAGTTAMPAGHSEICRVSALGDALS